MKFSQFYSVGMAMGMSPLEVDRCSLWQFQCAFDGYKRANGIKDAPRDVSDAQLAGMGIVGF